MTERYVLEIYEPGSRQDVLESLSSDLPFASVARGDFFNSESLSKYGMGAIKVAAVEHIVWSSTDGPKHKLCVYTEVV